MKVVIDIPDYIYDAIMDAKKHRDQVFGGRTYLQMLVKGVEEGTVLPLNHGPLIDADEVMKEVFGLIEDVLDTLIEVGNGTTDEMLHEAANKLFRVRDLLEAKS